MNFVDVHLNDYAAATFHLSPLEDGIYWRLLRCYYRDEQPLPADLKQVARMAGARTKDEVEAVDSILREFFKLESDGWRQARCDEEIERCREKREKAKASAAASWQSPKRKANAKQTHSDGNATHSPSTHSPTKPEGKPSGSSAGRKKQSLDLSLWHSLPSAQTLSDWVAMRKAKRAPVSQTVIDRFAGEINLAFAAGYTADDCLSLCIVKGWQGFKFEWLKNEEANHGRHQRAVGQTRDDRNRQALADYLNNLDEEDAGAGVGHAAQSPLGI